MTVEVKIRISIIIIPYFGIAMPRPPFNQILLINATADFYFFNMCCTWKSWGSPGETCPHRPLIFLDYKVIVYCVCDQVYDTSKLEAARPRLKLFFFYGSGYSISIYILGISPTEQEESAARSVPRLARCA